MYNLLFALDVIYEQHWSTDVPYRVLIYSAQYHRSSCPGNVCMVHWRRRRLAKVSPVQTAAVLFPDSRNHGTEFTSQPNTMVSSNTHGEDSSGYIYCMQVVNWSLNHVCFSIGIQKKIYWSPQPLLKTSDFIIPFPLLSFAIFLLYTQHPWWIPTKCIGLFSFFFLWFIVPLLFVFSFSFSVS